MSLQTEIEERRKEIFSDRLSMSIGELAGLYERAELDTHPKFQRILRWRDEQKSKLIESIMLRIPVPPIFVAQDKTGKWDVVDGVQRLGTIFEFLGIQKDQDGARKPPFVVTHSKLLPSLEGKAFNDPADETRSLSTAQQLDFKRSRLDLQIILKESDPSSKFELFERLNTGGSLASPQEVRNCVMVWIDESLFDWMKELWEEEHFMEAVQLSERLQEEQYHAELVLRFLVLKTVSEKVLPGLRDLGEFLNDENRRIPNDRKFDRKVERRIFTSSFELISKSSGSDAFRKFNKAKDAFQGPFLISAYEAVAMGVAYNWESWRRDKNAAAKLQKRIKSMWSESEFTEHIGVGINAASRIQHTIPFGRGFFRP